MERSIYEIQFKDDFNLRMTSEDNSLEQIDFDKMAFEAVLGDIVLRAKEKPTTVEKTEALWQWCCTQLGLVLQKTILVEDGDQDPIDTLIHTAFRFKEMKNMDGNNQDKSITPVDLMEHLLSYIHKEDQINSVIYVAQMNDGTVSSGWTDLTYPEAIGLLEIGKLQVFSEMEKEFAIEKK